MLKKILSIVISILLSIFLINKTRINYYCFVILFLLFDYLIYNFYSSKKYYKVSIIISSILSFIFVICDSINTNYFIDIPIFKFIIDYIGYFVLFNLIVINLYNFLDKRKDDNSIINFFNKEILSTNKFSFIFNFISMFLVNFIFLLRFYPGNLTYDSYNQIKQAMGIIDISNNHSLLHTSILKLFFKLISNINLSVFIYSIFQIIIVSLVFSYIMHFLSKKNVSKILKMLCFIFFIFHPINIFYSFTVWKDILFSISLVMVCLYINKIDEDNFNNIDKVLLFIFSILVMYLRNNGPFVILLSFIVILLIKRKIFKRIFLLFLSIILTFFISKSFIFKVLNINDYSVKEILSLPSQSIARIYKYKYNELTKDEISKIERFYSSEVGNLYIPYISDNTKGLLNEEYYLKHKKEYIDLNLSLLKRFKKEYIESFISNSYGYYYVGTNYATIILSDSDELGIEHKNIINNYLLVGIVSIILLSIVITFIINIEDKRKLLLLLILIPFLYPLNKNNYFISMFFSIGFYSLLTVILFIYNKINKNKICYFIPIIVLWMMILFSPVYAEFRYLYPLFLMCPIYLVNRNNH